MASLTGKSYSFFAFILGFVLANLSLALGAYSLNLKIPTIVTVDLVMLAIGFLLVSIIIYWKDFRFFIITGRERFGVLLLSQPATSLMLLVLIVFAPALPVNMSPSNADYLLGVSSTIIILFFLVFVLIWFFITSISTLTYPSSFLMLSIILPATFNITAVISQVSSHPGSLSMLGLLFSLFVFIFSFSRYQILLTPSFDRRQIVDSVNLGWVVVDKREIIVDMNPAAEKILGKSSINLIGHSGKELISNWQTLFPDSNQSEKELQASINHHNRWSYFHVRSLPLSYNDEFMGRVLIWNDITERKKSEDVRKHTIDQTLGLLHSISLVASHTTDLRSFLETAIFQIVTGFNCTLGLIFMREIDFIGEEKANLELVGTYSSLDLPTIENIVQSLYPILAHLDGVAQIKSSELRHSQAIKDIGDELDELVICPISIDGQQEGAIVLFRPDKFPLVSDEIIRLEMLSNELSTLINVERQRHGYASLAERKKMIRVLHDTVTQQLYGLLYFIDVARAQLDYGTINSLSSTLSKLNETGRQALKEMRMFLYSLQPVSVSKIGFIAAVNQRLEAVEGRASVKTRFVPPEDVKLTLKQEICLYEITLEALNNILRHAYASNVTIVLKHTAKNIILEIIDDGRGFDVKSRKNSGGIGLQNMRESARQIHARIFFLSEVNKGSRVKVIIPKNRVPTAFAAEEVS